MRSAILTTALLLILTSTAHAWHAAGHRLTAEIAFDLLNENQQRHVGAILRGHPRFSEDFAKFMPDEIRTADENAQTRWMFAHASNWPDQLDDLDEALREQYHRSTWHYINRPVFLTGKDERRLATTIDQNTSTEFSPPLRKGLNIIQALTGNLLVWRDDNASDADKAVALCWILHLTGDMHEPMHNVALFSADYFPEGDRGGNLIGVRRGKDVTNLHAVWDGLASRFEYVVPDDATRELLANDLPDIGSIPKWSHQYRDMAEEFVYTAEVRQKLLAEPPDNEYPVITLSRDYITASSKIVESQIIIAGHRIAALIVD